MRLPHAPKSGFGQFNHPILMEDEIQARVEDKPINRRRRRNQGWRQSGERPERHILQRANHTCEKCGKRPATEVHHLTYLRVFNEFPSDLVALCRQCHAEIHWRQPALGSRLPVPGRIFDHISATLATTPRNGSDETHFIARGSIGSSVSSHLAESECVSLNTRVEKLDLEFAVADGAALSDELVEALPRDDALSIGIGVRAVAGAP